MKKIMYVLLLLLCSAALFGAAYSYDSGVFTINQGGDFNIKYYSPASKYGQVTDFGYYFINDPSKKISLDTHLTGNETVTIKNIAKDAKIGLYFDTKNDSFGTSYSQAGLNDGGRDLFYYVDEETGKHGGYFTFGDKKWAAGQVLAFKVDVTGQPLPGLITTLVVAGGICGGAYAARKKKKQA